MKHCRFRLLVVVLAAISLNCAAQGGRDSLTMAMLVPQQAVKFSPLHLLNFYPTLEFSFEQRIAPRVTVQLEAGYVLNFNNWDEDFLDKRGVKLKLEGRNYFFGRTDKRKLYYLAGEIYANIINFDRTTSIQECFDMSCEHPFIRYATGTMAYREKGITVKAGLMKYYGRFFFDISSGWTIRDIRYFELSDFQLEQNTGWAFWEIPNEDDRIILAPNLGARIGYRLR